jgi:tRNA pseudouridine55 synthase
VESGILNVGKPLGLSSFAVVRSIGRLPGVVKVGHGGTLDPAADGVLPILINAATRLADFVHVWPKRYRATAAFGYISDTYDREGTVSPAGDTGSITAQQIMVELLSFTGRIDQVPPMHSALKQGGEALYRKARRGETVVRAARPVEVYAIHLLDYDPAAATAQLEIDCGQGMYVRSLVHDLGQRLGCGAYLAALTRTAYGPLQLGAAVSPATLSEAGDGWASWLLPLGLPLETWPAIHLQAAEAEAITQGRSITAPANGTGRYQLLDGEGILLGWGVVDEATQRVQPKAVFPR